MQKCLVCKERNYCCTNCRVQDWSKYHKNMCVGLEGNQKKNAYEEMGEVLGIGSYGEVRLVRDKASYNLYAMKIIDKKSAEQQSNLETITREISVQKELHHPNIIHLHDSFEDDQFIYIVLEHAESGSLFQKLRENRCLSEEVARRYFSQVLAGMIYLHDRHVVHRDIKPENILLDRNDRVKICDFGWCVKGDEPRSTFCGTLAYMAPEMIKGQPHSSEVDIWALGVLLYELLHGCSPFEAARDMDKVQKIVNCRIEFDEGISENAKDIIMKMVQVKQDKRIRLREALEHPFFDCYESGEKKESGEGLGARERSFVSRGVEGNRVEKNENGKGFGNVLENLERLEGESGEKRNWSGQVTEGVKGFGGRNDERVKKIPGRYEGKGKISEDFSEKINMIMERKKEDEKVKHNADRGKNKSTIKSNTPAPKMQTNKTESKFEEDLSGSCFTTESVDVTFSNIEIDPDDDKFVANPFRLKEESRGNKTSLASDSIESTKSKIIHKDTSKEESIFNNLDNWIKAPARRKGGKRKTPALDKTRDKFIEKPLEELKEKSVVKPKSIPEKKNELIAEKKSIQAMPQRESASNAFSKQVTRQLLHERTKIIHTEENDEVSDEERVSMNIYKKHTLENIKQKRFPESSAIKNPEKSLPYHQNNRSKTPAIISFPVPHRESVYYSHECSPRNNLKSANVFNIPELDFYSDHSDSDKAEGEGHIKSPYFDDHSFSSEEERPSCIITQDTYRKACNIFDEAEKASVLSSLRHSPSPSSLRPSSDMYAKVPARKRCSLDKNEHSFLNKKDYEPGSKAISDRNKGKSGKKLNDYQTQRKMIEIKHESYYNRLEEAWIDREHDLVEASDVSEYEVDDEHEIDFREYDRILRDPPSIVSETEDYDKVMLRDNKKLIQRKKELEDMINIIDKQNGRPVKQIKDQVKPKKKEGGILEWIGGLIGCSDRN